MRGTSLLFNAGSKNSEWLVAFAFGRSEFSGFLSFSLDAPSSHLPIILLLVVSNFPRSLGWHPYLNSIIGRAEFHETKLAVATLTNSDSKTYRVYFKAITVPTTSKNTELSVYSYHRSTVYCTDL